AIPDQRRMCRQSLVRVFEFRRREDAPKPALRARGAPWRRASGRLPWGVWAAGRWPGAFGWLLGAAGMAGAFPGVSLWIVDAAWMQRGCSEDAAGDGTKTQEGDNGGRSADRNVDRPYGLYQTGRPGRRLRVRCSKRYFVLRLGLETQPGCR
ncbi:MAG: hypothetical protein ACI9EF_003993, partial [Pseudohongiellaceae bacterium]